MTVLVTGAAGFIGAQVSRDLLARGEAVLGIDSFAPTYDVQLKRARLERLQGQRGFRFVEANVADRAAMSSILAGEPGIVRILHLAARAGVRQSMQQPDLYLSENVGGQAVLLDLAASLDRLEHFVYASSSSVYGANTKVPFAPQDRIDEPRSVYAVSKRSCELLAETYASLMGLKVTGLRYFTVYGPWGRPDMAPHIFTRALFAGEPILLYHHGRARRDFTFIDDIVAGTLAIAASPAERPGHRLYNLGNASAQTVTDVLAQFERATGCTARAELAPAPPGDVAETWADISATERDFGWTPKVPLDEGVQRFVAWYRDYYRI